MVSFFELDLPLDVMVISQYCRVDTQRGVTQQIVLLKMKQLSINYSSNDKTCISVKFKCVYLWQSNYNDLDLSNLFREYVMFTSTRWQFSKILPQRDYFSAKFSCTTTNFMGLVPSGGLVAPSCGLHHFCMTKVYILHQ